MSNGDERWLCLGGLQHSWVVTGWAVADESMGANELFCATCGQLVGRDRTDQDWMWVPLAGD